MSVPSKHVLLIMFVLVFAALQISFSQTKDSIRNSPDMYWGEADSENELEANDEALAMLTRQIATIVSSSFESIVKEDNNNITESARKVISTYSTATLKDVRTISQQAGTRVNVFKYISRQEVEKIFTDRLRLINNIYLKAREFEEKKNLAYALKWYYYCVVLRNSIPVTNAVFDETDFDTELASRINNIINGIEFALKEDIKISETERELKFRVTIQGEPVQMLDFSYWDGTGQLNISALDGLATVRLFGSSVGFEKIDLNVKYSYYECRDEIKEVGSLWNLISKPSFKNLKQIRLIISNAVPAKAEADQTDKNIYKYSNGKYAISVTNSEDCPYTEKISRTAMQFLDVLEGKKLSKTSKFYADESLAHSIQSLIKYNNPVPADKNISADINKTAFGWELRKIRMSNSYASIRKQSNEYLVMDFDEKGNFYDFSFGITEGLYNEFTDQAKYAGDWGNRQVIIKFLEKYRTSFLIRDIAMLDSLFAEDAIIIIGKVLSKKYSGEMYKYIRLNDQQPDISYMTYTKNEYLKNQKQVFRNQKDLFVGYSTFRITKKNQTPGVYGVSMRQNYNATSYSDEGHLFLLIDFNDNQPQIYVRSWQPQEWDDSSLIKLSNFNLNK